MAVWVRTSPGGTPSGVCAQAGTSQAGSPGMQRMLQPPPGCCCPGPAARGCPKARQRLPLSVGKGARLLQGPGRAPVAGDRPPLCSLEGPQAPAHPPRCLSPACPGCKCSHLMMGQWGSWSCTPLVGGRPHPAASPAAGEPPQHPALRFPTSVKVAPSSDAPSSNATSPRPLLLPGSCSPAPQSPQFG